MSGLTNWWAAKPWRVYPWADDGWRYRTLYRMGRRGARHPMDPFGHTYLSGGEPKGRLAALWAAIAFPHVHDEDELLVEPKDHPPNPEVDARQLAAYRQAFERDWTVPPGETLAELLGERGVAPLDLAARLDEALDEDVGLTFVVGLLTGERPITPPIAYELEQMFGVSTAFWLNLEQLYREDLAALHPGCTVDLAHHPAVRNAAAEAGIDVTRCEFCEGPLDADHPWRRGMDGACAHEACL